MAIIAAQLVIRAKSAEDFIQHCMRCLPPKFELFQGLFHVGILILGTSYIFDCTFASSLCEGLAYFSCI